MLLVFTLLAVLFLAGQAAKPSNWSWMFSGATPEQSDASGLEDSQIDTRLPRDSPPAADSLPPGVVKIESFSKPTVDDSPGQLFLDIEPDRYNVVQDNTVFRSAELKLWYELLGGLRDTTIEELQSAPAQSVGFTQLYKQPNSYRGRLVMLDGIIRRAHRIDAAKNDSGIKSYMKCWFFPSGSPNPVVVYATELPADFPEGMDLHESTKVHGVFFKRWAYKAGGGLMTAPMVLAKTVDWRPAPVVVEKKVQPNIRSMRWMVGLAAILAAVIAWTVYRQSVQSESLPTLTEEESTLRESFTELEKLDLESPAEAMKRNS